MRRALLPFLLLLTSCAKEPTMPAAVPPLPSEPPSKAETEVATFGGGCFWCTEAVFLEIKGVSKVVSGYSGGHVKNPTYEAVCNGTTGHAEVIQITFDPRVVGYEKLLEAFWLTHDPTTLNRQGNDTGTQYRSAVFYHNDRQKELTEKYIKKLTDEKVFENPIVTEVVKFEEFYPAEDYHQNFYARNPNQGYCNAVIPAKLAKLKKAFSGVK
jgi:peptide-methionine (S)-S-oxide reductase